VGTEFGEIPFFILNPNYHPPGNERMRTESPADAKKGPERPWLRNMVALW
jgi:hypothetical protein